MMKTTQASSRSHAEAFELIPWLVNGKLPQSELEWLNSHLAGCDECRAEVALQRRLRQAIRREESNIEYAPHASFHKLWSRIEQASRDEPGEPDDRSAVRGERSFTAPAATPPRRRWMAAAAVTLLVIGAGVLLASSWIRADYRTASAPQQPSGRDGEIRAVFAPNVTVDELTRIVSETRLTIVNGPSDAGVYTLAVPAGRDMTAGEALVRLRSDPRVRFAEPVVAPRGPP